MAAKVRLRTGATVDEKVVRNTMFSLQLLVSAKPMLFYDLVEASRSASFQLCPEYVGELRQRRLINGVDSKNHAIFNKDVRKVVRAASEGKGLDIQMVSPFDNSRK